MTDAANVSYATDIRPLFRPSDVKDMIRFGRFDLSKYEDVSARAEVILERLTDGDMPCDAPWPQDQIDLFAKWISDGKQA